MGCPYLQFFQGECFLLQDLSRKGVNPRQYRISPVFFLGRKVGCTINIGLQPFFSLKGRPFKGRVHQIRSIRLFHPIISGLGISEIVQGRGTVKVRIRLIELPREGAAAV